jgi:hypothetical protein
LVADIKIPILRFFSQKKFEKFGENLTLATIKTGKTDN